ncbi:hypothetical protein ACK3TF_005079 [Chlorella vulgaris]
MALCCGAVVLLAAGVAGSNAGTSWCWWSLWPGLGHVVVGRIVQVEATRWLVDIHATTLAVLPLSTVGGAVSKAAEGAVACSVYSPLHPARPAIAAMPRDSEMGFGLAAQASLPRGRLARYLQMPTPDLVRRLCLPLHH